MLSQRKITDNLREAIIDGHRLATDANAPTCWYSHAKSQTDKAARLVNLDPRLFGGIVAVTSANCFVSENWARALSYATTGKATFTGHLVDAYCRRVQITGDYTVRSPSGKPTPKAEEFRRNLMGDLGRCTIDRHIYDVAVGKMGVKASNTLRSRILVAMHRLTKELAIPSVSESQALAWYSAKNAKRHADPFALFSIGDHFEEALRFESVG